MKSCQIFVIYEFNVTISKQLEDKDSCRLDDQLTNFLTN